MTEQHPRTRLAWRRTLVLLTQLVLVAAIAAGALSPIHAAAAQSGGTGPNDDITDVTGIQVGNYTNTQAMTGTTVVYATNRATGGVDVRSGTPITRETDLLNPVNEVQHLNAVLLTGGGDYGLAAGPGVMQYLEDHNTGYPVGATPDQVVPIVPGAAINDLGRSGHFDVRPDASYGNAAITAAAGGPIPQGNVGAGAGAMAGSLKGGLGSASEQVISSQTGQPIGMVGVLVVVNSVGTPVDTSNGCRLLGAEYGLSSDFPGYSKPSAGCGDYAPLGPPSSGPLLNQGGVIGVVATDINLDKALTEKMAQVSQDGITRAVNPAHTMFDGDVMFGMSTGTVTPAVGSIPDCIHAEVSLSDIGCLLVMNDILAAAHDATSRAIAYAMLDARTVPGMAMSYCGQFPGACTAAMSGTAGAGTAPSHAVGGALRLPTISAPVNGAVPPAPSAPSVIPRLPSKLGLAAAVARVSVGFDVLLGFAGLLLPLAVAALGERLGWKPPRRRRRRPALSAPGEER